MGLLLSVVIFLLRITGSYLFLAFRNSSSPMYTSAVLSIFFEELWRLRETLDVVEILILESLETRWGLLPRRPLEELSFTDIAWIEPTQTSREESEGYILEEKQVFFVLSISTMYAVTSCILSKSTFFSLHEHNQSFHFSCQQQLYCRRPRRPSHSESCKLC